MFHSAIMLEVLASLNLFLSLELLGNPIGGVDDILSEWGTSSDKRTPAATNNRR
jgi:hypothetical protein